MPHGRPISTATWPWSRRPGRGSTAARRARAPAGWNASWTAWTRKRRTSGRRWSMPANAGTRSRHCGSRGRWATTPTCAATTRRSGSGWTPRSRMARTHPRRCGPRRCSAAGVWRSCSATTWLRSAAWMPRCASSGTPGMPVGSPTRSRYSAAWPGSTAGTPARWNCTLRGWPWPRPSVTAGQRHGRTATWASPRGCSATSPGPARSAARPWPYSVSSRTWRASHGH